MQRLNSYIGLRIINKVNEYKLQRGERIWYRELRRKTRLRSKTFDPWIERLRKYDLLTLPGNKILGSRVYIDVTERARRYIKTGKLLDYLNRVTKKEMLHRLTNNKLRSVDAYLLISIIAADGSSRYELMPGKKLEHRLSRHDFFNDRVKMMTTIDRNWRPGVGLSDFSIRGQKIFKELDKTTKIRNNFGELFAHVNGSKAQIQEYLNDLKASRPPIIKEISISDHQFPKYEIVFLEEYLTDSRTSDNADENYNKILIQNNDDSKKEAGSLGLDYEIYYFNESDKYAIKLIFDINDRKIIKSLGLTTTYKTREDFSVATWGETRYIIADPLLREFIINCLTLLWASVEIMLHAYTYDYQEFGKYMNKYIDWFEYLFGKERRIEIHSPIDSKRKRSGHRYDGKWSKDLEQGNIQYYLKILSNKKYDIIHKKYSVISRPLMKVAYPNFLDKYLSRE